MIVPTRRQRRTSCERAGRSRTARSIAGWGWLRECVGPGGSLYVAQPATGEIWRVDPDSGAKTLYASGLPRRFSELPFGGVMDVAFIGSTAYALVSVVGSVFPRRPVRLSPANRRDIPRERAYELDRRRRHRHVCVREPAVRVPVRCPDGSPVRAGDVSRRIPRDGRTSQPRASRHAGRHDHATDRVRRRRPDGAGHLRNTIYLAEAGPVPHEPQNGKIVSFEPGSSTATDVASGARLAVDVEMGRGRTLFALSQGLFPCGGDPACAGSPASHDTGALMRANGAGGFTTIADELDQPSSLEIIGNTAYVVTLGGEVWTIDNVAGPPYG